MRVPLSKVYRAFPELDRFGDAACDGFVRQAVKRHTGEQALCALLAFPLAAMVLVVWWWIGRIISAVLPSGLGRWEDGPGLVLALLYGVAGPVSAILSVLVLRDWWLRRAISRQIADTRCPGCRYSMLGLEVVGGWMTCPECGLKRSLADTGLTAADFVPGPRGVPAAGSA